MKHQYWLKDKLNDAHRSEKIHFEEQLEHQRGYHDVDYDRDYTLEEVNEGLHTGEYYIFFREGDDDLYNWYNGWGIVPNGLVRHNIDNRAGTGSKSETNTATPKLLKPQVGTAYIDFAERVGLVKKDYFQKNNCPDGQVGFSIPFEKSYIATGTGKTEEEAQRNASKKLKEQTKNFNQEAQAWANEHGTCDSEHGTGSGSGAIGPSAR